MTWRYQRCPLANDPPETIPPDAIQVYHKLCVHHRSHSIPNPGKRTKHNTARAPEPEYNSNASLRSLCATEFGRLEPLNTTYVDYMDGGLHPESLVSNYPPEILNQRLDVGVDHM